MKNESAARLVSLYPGAWRQRYGDEFVHVLRDQPLTLRLALDVIGGAIDARLQGAKMATTATLLKRCAAGGPKMTTEDAWRASGVMIGSSLLFAGLYIWAKMNFENEDMVDAFGIMAYPAALLVTMPYYYMKDHSRTAKIVVVGGCLAILAGISYLTALI
jgi:hypothetical protein